MPPKKAGKKGAAEPAKLHDKEALRRAETEIAALQRQLEIRVHETHAARLKEREWREKCAAYDAALKAQQEDTLDITSDMSRQFRVRYNRDTASPVCDKTGTRHHRCVLQQRHGITGVRCNRDTASRPA